MKRTLMALVTALSPTSLFIQLAKITGVIILFHHIGYTQTFQTHLNYHNAGIAADNFGYSGLPISDTSYIVAGATFRTDQTKDIYFAKLNAEGQFLDLPNYPEITNDGTLDMDVHIERVGDSRFNAGYIFCTTNDDGNNGSRLHLIRTDEDGLTGPVEVPNSTWSQRYGENTHGACVKEDQGGNFIAVGWTTTNNNQTNVFAVKTATDGTLLWQKEYQFSPRTNPTLASKAYSVAEFSDYTLPNGNIVDVYGLTGSVDRHVFILYLDQTTGDIVHSEVHNVEDNNGVAIGYDIQQDYNNGGAVIIGVYHTGVNTPQHILFLKSSFNQLQIATIDIPNSFYDAAYSIQLDFDANGSYVITGGTDEVIPQGTALGAIALKLLPNGMPVWARSYLNPDKGYTHANGKRIELTADNGLFITGTTWKIDGQTISYDLLAIKTEQNGNSCRDDCFQEISPIFTPQPQLPMNIEVQASNHENQLKGRAFNNPIEHFQDFCCPAPCGADIEITKRKSPDRPLEPGETVTFTISACNTTDCDTGGIVIIDQLHPDCFVFEASDATGGAYDPTVGYWTIAQLPANTCVSLSISATFIGTDICYNCAYLQGSDAVGHNNSSCVLVPTVCCNDNQNQLINGYFDNDLNNWTLGGTPNYRENDGCQERGSVQMWGNQAIGESISQAVHFRASHSYDISYCVRGIQFFAPNAPFLRVRLRATQGAIAYGECPAGTCETIDLSPEITTMDWTTFCISDWVPSQDYDSLIITIETDVDAPFIDETSFGRLDDICVEENRCRDLDIGITKTASNYTPEPNELIKFVVEACNLSNCIATDVLILDAITNNCFEITNILTSTGTYTPNSSNIWDIPELAGGECAELVVTVRYLGTSGGCVNCASLQSQDDNRNNNESCVTIIGPPCQTDLEVEKTITTEGNVLVFEIKVTNLSDCDTTNVSVIDFLPPHCLQLVSSANGVTTSSGTYTSGNGRWLIPLIAQNGCETLTLMTHFVGDPTNPNDPACINCAYLGVTDVNPRNNRSCVVVTDPNCRVDIDINKRIDNRSPSVGDTVTFTISACNLSDCDTTDIFVLEQAGICFDILDAQPSSGTYTAPLWDIPIVFADSCERLVLTALINSATECTNCAFLDTGIDANPDNNQGCVNITPECCDETRNEIINGGFSPNDLTDDWIITSGSPEHYMADSCSTPHCVEMWGEMTNGESISQALNFVAGVTYDISYCAKAAYMSVSSNPGTKVRLRASQNLVAYGECNPANCETIHLSPLMSVTDGWTQFCFSWTPTANYSLLTINVEPDVPEGNPNDIVYGRIDNVCIATREPESCQPNAAVSTFSTFISNPILLSEQGRSGLQSPIDRSIVVVGESEGRKLSYADPDVKDIWFGRLNEEGCVQPTATYIADETNETPYFIDPALDPNGNVPDGYVLTGAINNGVQPTANFDNNDLLLVRTDANGTVLCQERYGEIFSNEIGRCVRQDSRGHFIALGSKTSEQGVQSIFLVKVESACEANGGFNLLFSKEYSGITGGQLDPHGLAVVTNINSTNGTVIPEAYAITGSVTTGSLTNVFLLIVDLAGNIVQELQWSFLQDSEDIGYSIQQDHDGGLIIAGSSEDANPNMPNTEHIFVLKTNNSANVQWANLYDIPNSINEQAHYIQLTNDGGYIITGKSHFPDFFINNQDDSDAFLLKLSGQATVDWFRTYPTPENYDGAVGHRVEPAIEGNGYILTASAFINPLGPSTTFNYAHPEYAIMVVKTDPMGLVENVTDIDGTATECCQERHPTQRIGFEPFATSLVLADVDREEEEVTQLSNLEVKELQQFCGDSCRIDFPMCIINNHTAQTVAFFDCGGDIPNASVNYYWDFGDGTFSTEENPVHSYTQPGLYRVCFTKSVLEESAVCGEYACAKTRCIYIWVRPIIEIDDFTIDLPDDRPIGLIILIAAPQTGDIRPDNDNNAIIYIPDNNFVGVDSFTIALCDESENCDTVTMTIQLVNNITLVQAKTRLGGAYQPSTGMMRTNLRQQNLLPLQQPFNQSPWFYDGGEGVPDSSVIPRDAVDYVLIEARAADNLNTTGEQHAAFLLQDGTIVSMDGTPGVPFFTIIPEQSYQLLVYALGHVGIASKEAIIFPTIDVYDFTQPSFVLGEEAQLMSVATNVFGQITGDVDGNGIVSVNDFNELVLRLGSSNTYGRADINKDGQTTIIDFNAYQQHASHIGVQMVRY